MEFYDRNVAKIYRYIYFRVGSEEQAQDLTSEVFLRCWQRLNSRQESISNLRAFFYQVARNLIVDFYRQKDRAPLSLEEIADKKIADKSDGPSETVSIALEMESVKRALSHLKDDYQEMQPHR